METALEKSEIELDKESVEQVRKLFDDYVVDPLGTKLLDSEKRLKGDEAERVEQLKQDLAPKLSRTNAYLEGLIQALEIPKTHWPIWKASWITLEPALKTTLKMTLRINSMFRMKRWKPA